MYYTSNTNFRLDFFAIVETTLLSRIARRKKGGNTLIYDNIVVFGAKKISLLARLGKQFLWDYYRLLYTLKRVRLSLFFVNILTRLPSYFMRVFVGRALLINNVPP